MSFMIAKIAHVDHCIVLEHYHQHFRRIAALGVVLCPESPVAVLSSISSRYACLSQSCNRGRYYRDVCHFHVLIVLLVLVRENVLYTRGRTE